MGPILAGVSCGGCPRSPHSRDVCERAWPPRERLELDGAVLRFASGFTRRANSARVDGGGDDLDGLIDARRAASTAAAGCGRGSG